jgi:putative oxidoreductase
VAAAQIVGAVALLVPSLVLPGAVLLAGILAGAIVTHARFDPPAQLLAPAVCLLLLLPVLWSVRPGFLR